MVSRWTRRLWTLAAVCVLLAAVASMSLIGRPGIHHIPLSGRSAQPAATHPIPVQSALPNPKSSGIAQPPIRMKSWLVDLVVYGCGVSMLLILVGALVYVIKQFIGERQAQRRTGLGNVPPMTRRDAVLAAVDAGIAELARDDGDARAAVIVCWVRLEEVAAAAGTAREPGETPSDLVARMLADHQVSANTLVSLADLYRTARYSTQVIDAPMRAQALTALQRLRDELQHSRSGPLADEVELDDQDNRGRVGSNSDPAR
jgi:Domain of unknown function (DUF4129)